MTVQDELWVALGDVRDPELDQAITDLGFVSECTVDGAGRARIRLRLPTYFCAPNFAYLMVADAYDAARAVEGVTDLDVALVDHFASEEINAGVAARGGISGAFPGETDGDDLDDLRNTFVRKAVLAGQDRVCRALLADGYTVEQLWSLRIRDLPASDDVTRMTARRAELGLPAGPHDPLLIDGAGRPVEAGNVPLHLKLARATRVNIEANTSLCRGLLVTRYGEQAGAREPARAAV